MAETKALASGRTIREASEGLLLETVRKDERTGRSIGRPYLEILGRIKEEFPECETTVKCLRWYAVHLNRDPDIRMPFRPRKRPMNGGK